MIYFIADDHAVKIGYASQIGRRVSNLQCANPRPLTLLASCSGDEFLETKIHHALPGRISRTREWFIRTPELMGLIADINARGDVAISQFMEQKASAKRNSRINWFEHEKKFKADTKRVFNELANKHGIFEISKILGCSKQMVALYCKGKSLPSGLKFVRLFDAIPETLEDFPDLKFFYDAIKAAEEAERIAA